jgi:hypothetical protein
MNLVGVDQFGRWSSGPINQIGANLEALFNEVRKHPVCPYREVRWFPAHLGFDIDPGEVLVHFVTRGSSLVTAHGGRGLGRAGTTWLSARGMISEVYVDEWLSNGDYLKQAANLVFHEALHNKVDASTAADIVHKDGTGLATGNPISGSTPLNLNNRAMMGSHMSNAVPQFLAGVQQSMSLVNGMPDFIEGSKAPTP